MNVRICERWDMPLEPSGKWFADWVRRSPREAGLHLTAGWHAVQELRDVCPPGYIKTACEYFGGIGAQALMIQKAFSPTWHTVVENNPDAVRHLMWMLLPRVGVFWADSYELGIIPADLVALDFGDLTVWKTRPGQPHRQLLNRVFASKPKAVLLTDIAGPRLHLHQERYESLLGPGTCGTYQTYLEAFAARLKKLYGYHLVAGFYHRWSTVMALTSEELGPGLFFRTPALPVGLEVSA